MSYPKPVLIVVGGPTGSGKTKMAIDLARHLQTEIINADSRQFYREMNIGTAKPTEEELALAPHHFVNCLSVWEPYSVGDFEKDALQLLEDKFKEKPVMIMTGGSGLYLQAVYEGLNEFPDVPLSVREKWEALHQEKGIEYLQEVLAKADPEYFAEVDQQNPVRLIRALSVYEVSGKTFSHFRKAAKPERPFQTILLYPDWSREVLYDRINKKVDQMVEEGLVEEVKSLLPYRHEKALQTVGYPEFFEFLDGKISLEEATEKMKMNSRRYAKRQITWFKKYGDWEKIPGDQPELALEIVLRKLA
jgi:tRNA dimethylallyltransferase